MTSNTDTDTEEDISPPTVPVTPAKHHPGALRRGHPPQYPGPQNAGFPPVPIIAPPTFAEIPKPPLSTDDEAEVRLKILLEKERGMRLDDGLAAYIDTTWANEDPVTLGDDQDPYNADQQLWNYETEGMYAIHVDARDISRHKFYSPRNQAVLLFHCRPGGIDLSVSTTPFEKKSYIGFCG